MRLDKFISHGTILSRAQVKRAIKAKLVEVNGAIALSPQQNVCETDTVSMEGTLVALPAPRYLMVNKPENCVSASRDTQHPTILDVIGEHDSNLSIAGRLDKDTTGLILLSDDGQWIHNVTSPRKGCTKTYIAKLDQPVTLGVIEAFAMGISLRNEAKPTLPAKLEALPDNLAKVDITEGKYHQVKRMFAACGLHVLRLQRIAIGDITLDPTLQPGQFRALTQQEIESFRA
ncbi:pseudouridine synthase [Aurantivibrio plasticivorans]